MRVEVNRLAALLFGTLLSSLAFSEDTGTASAEKIESPAPPFSPLLDFSTGSSLRLPLSDLRTPEIKPTTSQEEGFHAAPLPGESALISYLRKRGGQADAGAMPGSIPGVESSSPAPGGSFRLDTRAISKVWHNEPPRWSFGVETGRPFATEDWNTIRDYSFRFGGFGAGVREMPEEEHAQIRIWYEITW